MKITYVFNKCPPLDPLMRAYIHLFRLVLEVVDRAKVSVRKFFSMNNYFLKTLIGVR